MGKTKDGRKYNFSSFSALGKNLEFKGKRENDQQCAHSFFLPPSPFLYPKASFFLEKHSFVDPIKSSSSDTGETQMWIFMATFPQESLRVKCHSILR
jgi:hypothetical protein